MLSLCHVTFMSLRYLLDPCVCITLTYWKFWDMENIMSEWLYFVWLFRSLHFMSTIISRFDCFWGGLNPILINILVHNYGHMCVCAKCFNMELYWLLDRHFYRLTSLSVTWYWIVVFWESIPASSSSSQLLDIVSMKMKRNNLLPVTVFLLCW